ncbi:hypothetical protein IAR55_006469 [Kwoniella newhampshirensis]|uniref:Thioredoxin-like fold domain-containing protein n=1 Tax=Kwoniella newhampshirensis TaxID=1651941 RepID=A0AAW0YR93_9TREE
MLSLRSWLLSFLVTLFLLSISTVADESTIPSDASSTPAAASAAGDAGGEGVVDMVKRLVKAGLNGQTTDVEAQKEADLKDGIVRLTDENIDEVIQGGSEDDVWLVLVHGLPTELESSKVVEVHKNTSILAKANTLRTEFKFARLNYVDEWKTCSRWMLFKPPWLVIITDKGEKLRFVRGNQIKTDPEILWTIFEKGNWDTAPLWESEWAKGGNRAWLIELYIDLTARITKYTARIPKWPLMILVSWAGQALLQWLHRPRTPAPPAPGTPAPGRITITPEQKSAAHRAALKKKQDQAGSASGSRSAEGKKDK